MKETRSFVAVALVLAAAALLWNSKVGGAPPYQSGGGMVRVQHLAADVTAPQLTTVTTNAQTLFTERESPQNGRVLIRTLQNTGTTPVLYALNSTASATNYHGILAAGLVVRDGLGSVVDLSNWRGTVSVVTETGTSVVSVFELTQ